MSKTPQRRKKLRLTLGVFRAIAGTVGTLCLVGIVTLLVQLVRDGRDPAIAILGFIFFLIIGTAASVVFVLTHKALTLIRTLEQHGRMLRRMVEQSRLGDAEKRDEERK